MNAKPIPIKKPKIITREEWGAKPPKCEYERNPYINAITIHHTATSNVYEDAKAVVRAIQRYHQEERGWCDIGYHFLIDKDGNIYEGRPIWAVGAHVKGHNVGNIGISVIGNYEEVDINEKQLKALVDLISWLVYEYKISLGNIKGHRDYANTLCPGKYLYARLTEIRRRVGQRVYGFGEHIGVAVWWGIYSDYWSFNEEEWKRQVDEVFEILKKLGVNTIFFLVKDPWRYVYYKSRYVQLNPKYSWDPLKYIIKKAREYNISVHVYLNVLSEGEEKPNEYLNKHPDWIIKNAYGEPLGWVDPSAEEHVERVLKIVEEILEKYDVDGIQLDRIRIPRDAYYFPLSSKEFKEKYGLDPYKAKDKFYQFITEKINNIVKRVHDLVKKKNPFIRVSAAVMPDYDTARNTYCQDWATWLKKGYVDFVILMSYTASLTTFENYLLTAVKASEHTRPIYAGIGLYLGEVTPDIAYKEIMTALKKDGIYGICFFNVDAIVKRKEVHEVIPKAIKDYLEKESHKLEETKGGKILSLAPILYILLTPLIIFIIAVIWLIFKRYR